MKINTLINTIAVALGIVGVFLLIMGFAFSGTLCDDFRIAGFSFLALFGVWSVIKLKPLISGPPELED